VTAAKNPMRLNPLPAEIASWNATSVMRGRGYSAHADRNELQRWLTAVRGAGPRALPVHLVHGEPAAQDALAGLLRADGYVITTPERGTRQEF